MKLLITLDFPPEIGGIQRYLFDIVRFTFSPDDRVLIGCVRKPQHHFNELHTGVVWVASPLSFINKKLSCIPLFIHVLALILYNKNIEEIACGNVYAAIVPWAASFFFRLQYTVFTHGTEILFLQKRTFRAWLLKNILKKAHRLYSNSRFTAMLLKNAGIENEPTVIPPRVVVPADKARISGSLNKSGDLPKGELPQILCIGRLVPRKGFITALEALAQLPRELQWRCVIVGDGPLAPSLRTICVQKNIDTRVIFKCSLSNDELSREFDHSTIFVLPGAKEGGVEGFGIVLIEAMAHYVPIIAGRTGAVPEVLDNGTCGILVEPGDVGGLARELGNLLRDTPLRERIAAAAYERVKRHYAW